MLKSLHNPRFICFIAPLAVAVAVLLTVLLTVLLAMTSPFEPFETCWTLEPALKFVVTVLSATPTMFLSFVVYTLTCTSLIVFQILIVLKPLMKT